MSKRRRPKLSFADATDPRRPRGDIAGPGGPFDRNQTVVDAADAVLMDTIDVSMIEVASCDGEIKRAYALMLSGRINRTEEHARILFLFGADGAAGIVSEILGLANRAGPDIVLELSRKLAELPGGVPTFLKDDRNDTQ